MAISELQALAAVAALQGLDGDALATGPIKANEAHLFEKHFAKADAAAAAKSTGAPQGYFKLEKTTAFASKTEFKDEVPDKQQAKWLEANHPKKKLSKMRKVVGSVTYKEATEDLPSLLVAALRAATFYVCESHVNPESRFLYVTRIPAPFIGRSIDAAGVKDKNVPWMVVAVNGSDAINPGLVTVYPVRSVTHFVCLS